MAWHDIPANVAGKEPKNEIVKGGDHTACDLWREKSAVAGTFLWAGDFVDARARNSFIWLVDTDVTRFVRLG